ncbi:MAG: hypothetical protein M3N53_11825 [Actinomycetota bacterium]|nr:hypothetical protein [Actinomycetota bacterium]
MKRLIALSVAALLLGGAVPATAGKAKKTKQRQEGSVAVAAMFADGSCFFGLHRRINLVAQRQAQGIVGFDFDVDQKTAGGKFKLVPSDDSADLDISFYQSLGDPSDPAGVPANVPFETREAGGESGVVPPGYPIAIVCMVAGSNTDFTYTATSK